VAQRPGDVGVAVEAEHADGEVPASGECSRAVAFVGLGPVLVVGDVADVVNAVVKSDRGAVSASRLTRFPGPLPE
jgi:hypothetical protein